ncbi:MAG TPA: hypothetical protein VFK05_01425 [Polyangiaceae bacterium]|nr:hypothetical protein [Polyangiaceae bacterium]
MTRSGLRTLSVLAFIVGGFACDGREIVVFSPAQSGSAGAFGGSAGMGMAGSAPSSAGAPVAAGSDGSGANGGDGGDVGAQPCLTLWDCDPSWYCAKQRCSDPAGYCLPRPISDDPQLNPVCGCEDGITYWNDTLRKAYGISASTPGACQAGALSCGLSGFECGPNGTCSHQLPDLSACGMPGKGQCWIIPTDCSSDDRPSWLPCPPPPGAPQGPPPPCLTTCQALQAGWPYVRLHKGDLCQ